MAKVIAFPVARDAAGRLASVEHATQQHAEQAAAILMGTQVGQRTVKPAFGVPDFVGRREIDTEQVRSAFSRWLPFVDVLEIVQAPDADDPLKLDANVTVRAR